MTKEHMIDLLPYYLQDGKNINIYYKVLADMYNDLLNTFLDIIENRDLDVADLYGLDIIGDIVGQRRNSSDNEIYRNRIKTRVIQNNSRGYIDDINELAQIFLEDNFLGIRQGWHNEDLGYEPALLEVALNANKLESEKIDKNTYNLQCGTVETSNNTELGKGIQSIPTQRIIKKYKPIFIPDLQSATAIGVRLQYNIKNNTKKIEIQENLKLEFENKTDVIEVQSKQLVIEYESILQCGMPECSAELGVLL
mgnify:CR=1 FL=1